MRVRERVRERERERERATDNEIEKQWLAHFLFSRQVLPLGRRRRTKLKLKVQTFKNRQFKITWCSVGFWERAPPRIQSIEAYEELSRSKVLQRPNHAMKMTASCQFDQAVLEDVLNQLGLKNDPARKLETGNPIHVHKRKRIFPIWVSLSADFFIGR